MSNYSERKLQQALHQAGFYTQKAPSSGHGLLDPETEEYLDQADIVAIKDDPLLSQYEGHTSLVLIIEDKHREPPTVYIGDQERQQLERIEAVTGGKAYIAVKWRNRHGSHDFFDLSDLIDTGQNWKITDEISGMGIHDITP